MIKNTLSYNLNHISIGSLVAALILFAGAISFSYLINKLIIRKLKISEHGKFMLAKLTYALIGVASIFLSLHELGLHIAVVVSSLSVIGIAVGIAGKEIFTSFISGITLISDFDTKIGDYIEIDNKTGVIENIGILYTNIKLTNENILLKIPNSTLSNSNLINMSYYDNAFFNVTYVINLKETSIDQFEIINETIKPYSSEKIQIKPKLRLDSLEIGIISIPISKQYVSQFNTTISNLIMEKTKNYQISLTPDWEKIFVQIQWQYQLNEDKIFKSK